MPTRRSCATVAVLVAAGAATVTPPATAAALGTVHLSPTNTVAHGVSCAGQIRGLAQFGDFPPGDGRVLFGLTGQFVGISEAPGAHCWVLANVNWRNLDTGANGSTAARLEGSVAPFEGPPAQFFLYTGVGRVEVTVNTDLPHAPAVSQFVVVD